MSPNVLKWTLHISGHVDFIQYTYKSYILFVQRITKFKHFNKIDVQCILGSGVKGFKDDITECKKGNYKMKKNEVQSFTYEILSQNYAKSYSCSKKSIL